MANNSQSVTYIKKNARHHFVFNFAGMKDLQDEQFVTTPSFHALGRDWVIDCYPQNSRDEPLTFMRDGNNNFCSFFVRSEGIYEKFGATISCSLMKRDGKSSPLHLIEKWYPNWESKVKKSYPFLSQAFVYGESRLVYGESRHMLMKEFVNNGSFELICTIRDKDKCTLGIPKPLDLHSQIVKLLGSEETSDVTFDVEGRIFTCHRIILAARSPVFKAELFGNMAETTQKCIKIAGVSPVIFEAMLCFVYTDTLPYYPTIIVQHLFEAADRYAIEGLKALSEDRLLASLSIDLVATTLALAERHSSPRLKNACLDFIAEEGTLVTWMLTDEYLDLVRGFPSLKEEIRAKVYSLPSFRNAKMPKLS